MNDNTQYWLQTNRVTFQAVWDELPLRLRAPALAAREVIEKVADELPPLPVGDAPDFVKTLIELMFKSASVLLLAQGHVVLAKLVAFVGDVFLERYIDKIWDRLFEAQVVGMPRPVEAVATKLMYDYNNDEARLDAILGCDKPCTPTTCECND